MRSLGLLTVSATAAALLVAAPQAASWGPEPTGRDGGVCSPDASLLGFTDTLDKSTFEDTQVSGLSALAGTRGNNALALVDNVGTTPARFYDLRIGTSRGLDADIRGVTTLTRPDGTPYTGADFDGEGLVVERGHTILASSETEPSIRRFRRFDGRQIDEFEVPERFRVAPDGEAANNATFESLTATPNGRALYAGMEGPLESDGTDAEGRGLHRILRYDGSREHPRWFGRHGRRDYEPASQLAYRTDPGLGLVELVALGDGQLLALERGWESGFGNTVRIYRVTTTGAPDVTGVDSLQDVTDQRTFAGKELLVDLADCPPMGAEAEQPQPNPLLDNVEAMMLGKRLGRDRHELFLLSDDNSNPTQITRLYRLSVHLQDEPTLRGRALYDATEYQPGPVSGTQLSPTEVNGVTPPFDGQPIPGFSAMIPANPHRPWSSRLLAMPDNGFGAKDNSADFLLRAYEIEPDYGDGEVEVHDHIGFRDPDEKLPFPIVNEETSQRLLTGADFDIESLARDARGDLWIGEEFGPYLVKTDRTGKVLQAPIPLPDGGKSPQSPDLEPGETPTVPQSRGFEAMATSEDGWTLYPILEGARTDDPDQRRRIVYEFDVRSNSYTGRTWTFRVDSPELVVGDAAVVEDRKLILIERDNGGGPAAEVKKLVVTDLDDADEDGVLPRRTAVDLLRVPDPKGVSTPARADEYGVGEAFSFPLVSVEVVLPLHGDKVLVANDNNFPFNADRVPGRPDDIELITLDVPGLR